MSDDNTDKYLALFFLAWALIGLIFCLVPMIPEWLR